MLSNKIIILTDSINTNSGITRSILSSFKEANLTHAFSHQGERSKTTPIHDALCITPSRRGKYS